MAEKDTTTGDAREPAEHAPKLIPSPVSGVVPPVEYRWKPGESGNPAGRPRSAGASIREWLNEMGSWIADDISAVLSNPTAPAAKIAAARTWKDAMSRDRNSAGTPIAGAEVDRICDRTAGKPKAFVEVETKLPTSVEIVFPLTRAQSTTNNAG